MTKIKDNRIDGQDCGIGHGNILAPIRGKQKDAPFVHIKRLKGVSQQQHRWPRVALTRGVDNNVDKKSRIRSTRPWHWDAWQHTQHVAMAEAVADSWVEEAEAASPPPTTTETTNRSTTTIDKKNRQQCWQQQHRQQEDQQDRSWWLTRVMQDCQDHGIEGHGIMQSPKEWAQQEVQAKSCTTTRSSSMNQQTRRPTAAMTTTSTKQHWYQPRRNKRRALLISPTFKKCTLIAALHNKAPRSEPKQHNDNDRWITTTHPTRV